MWQRRCAIVADDVAVILCVCASGCGRWCCGWGIGGCIAAVGWYLGPCRGFLRGPCPSAAVGGGVADGVSDRSVAVGDWCHGRCPGYLVCGVPSYLSVTVALSWFSELPARSLTLGGLALALALLMALVWCGLLPTAVWQRWRCRGGWSLARVAGGGALGNGVVWLKVLVLLNACVHPAAVGGDVGGALAAVSLLRPDGVSVLPWLFDLLRMSAVGGGVVGGIGGCSVVMVGWRPWALPWLFVLCASWPFLPPGCCVGAAVFGAPVLGH